MVKKIVITVISLSILCFLCLIIFRTKTIQLQDTNIVKARVLKEFNTRNTVDKIQFVGIKYDESNMSYLVVIDYIEDSELKTKQYTVVDNVISEKYDSSDDSN